MRSRRKLPRFMLPLLTLAVLPPGALAQLAWEKRTIELDAAPTQREVIIEFPVRNAGEREIAIHAVRPRSAVVSAKASAESLPPGAEGTIEAVIPLDPRRREESGSIRVSTNDPDGGTVELRYIVRIPESVRIGARALRWDIGAPGAALEEKTVAIAINPAAGIKIEKVQAVPGGFVTRLEKGEKEGEFLVHVRPESVAAPLRARIVLETDPPLASPRLTSFMAVVGAAPERGKGEVDAGGTASEPASAPVKDGRGK